MFTKEKTNVSHTPEVVNSCGIQVSFFQAIIISHIEKDQKHNTTIIKLTKT